ncbi:MAG TPA: hypothetical protein IAC03_06870 [Candidatus Coprenecus pullistercoris]|nr:hypothetical protein [Candidatus Coprenecus pullistercoris]
MKKNIILTIALTAAAALTTVSCKIQHENYYSAYMTAVCEGSNDAISYLVTDDSIKVIPRNWPSILISLKQDQRISAVYTVPDGESNPLSAEFYSVSILPQDSIVLTSQPDTLGDDPIDIAGIWQSGGIYGAGRFLTVSFLIDDGGSKHTVTLAEDTALSSNPDADGYYHLVLKHNAFNDYPTHRINGILTFPLEEKYTAGIKGLKVTYLPIDSTSARTATVPYAN